MSDCEHEDNQAPAASIKQAKKKRHVYENIENLPVAELCKSTFAAVGEQPMMKKYRKSSKKRQEQVNDANNNEAQAEEQQEAQSQESAGPKVRIVDGKMVIDEQSLIQNKPELSQNGLVKIVEEDRNQQHTTSASYLPEHKRNNRSKWTVADTELFYDGLSVFGTDFGMISRVIFQNTKNRRQIKLKFNQEERRNGPRIDMALKTKKALADIVLPHDQENAIDAEENRGDANSDDVVVNLEATQQADETEQQ
ncbi:hypothetical protein MIR68_009725 [Amoeboaphelidium protococcarum]|nr:hypothetical protein MIR68_009725 [Amoeboaphelidium protococcarum]